MKFLGYESKNQFVNSSFLGISAPVQNNGVPSKLLTKSYFNAVSKQGIVRFDWINCNQKGELIDTEITLTAIKIHSDKMIHVNWRDISERKELLKSMQWQARHDPFT